LGYHQELDATEYCDEVKSEYYQQQIGVLRWAVELGRLDITFEVSLLAAFTALPHVKHLKVMLQVFSYLCQHDCSKLLMDDSFICITDELSLDWSELYPEAKEEIPASIPEPRGNQVQMIVFVDADHVGDKMMRRSRTGALLYRNCAPIQWLSKKQNSVETLTFGSEFVALRTPKLRMMGIPIDGPAHFRVDNMSVVYNTQSLESTLKKK
jgi:hypothetical protein